MKLRRAMIFAKDMPRMTAFYRDALGLRFLPERSSDDWAEFDAGGTSFALHAIPPAIASAIRIEDPPAARASTPIKLVFEVPDVAQARARLAELGGVVFQPNRLGACDGLDPEGNVFQLVPA